MSEIKHSETLRLAIELISRESVTPVDAGCQSIIAGRLERAGFHCETLRFGDVDNLWAQRGTGSPCLVFAGHTDVVPPGDLNDWDSPPFEPTLRDGFLYGRGAADMKSSLAAMVTACERFAAENPDHTGSVALLVTSDEEGPAVDGTVKVVDWLVNKGIIMDWCVVGEPSSSEVLGDVVKHGRRGSLGGRLTVKGVQGHVAYPELAVNPIHQAARAIEALSTEVWDHGNGSFPPTSFQISNIHGGTGATNVIPGKLEVIFNLRYSTELTDTQIRKRVQSILDEHPLEYEIEWTHSGHPFLTQSGKLLDAVVSSIDEVIAIKTQPSTAGGTSDGRFLAPHGIEVVELGPVNQTIHQVNECVRAKDLEDLSDIYRTIINKLLGNI